MSSLQEVLAKIKSNAQDVLNNEIAEQIKKTEHEHVISDVYDIYQPHMYVRKMDDNGLSDVNNMVSKPYGNLGVEVINNTLHANYKTEGYTYVSDVVENGSGYEFVGYGLEYQQPRPFQENTIEELKNNGEITKLLKEGLKDRGINIE